MKLKLIISLVFITIISIVRAQITSSTISGRATDENGKPLPGVSILVTNNGTGGSYNTTTNAEGRYTIANLNPGGPYTLQATFIGLAADIISNANLSLGLSSYNFILMEESALIDDVVVNGRVNQNVRGGTRISEAQIKRMPSISRSLQDFTRTTPQSSNNSFMGTNFRYNNVTLDGAINNDAIGFSPSLGGQGNTSGQPGSSTRTNPVSLDAIQDIQVYLAPFDVKIGNFLGGSINAVTRSGSNEVTGSVYGFGRNAAITGRNRAGDNSSMPSSFYEYQTGFRLGFPIIRNKLFFFTNQEITRRQDPVILAAGSEDMPVINLEQAQQITDYLFSRYNLDAGEYGDYNTYSRSNKFFNRVDWIINDKHNLSVRNNTILSQATNLERDQQNFRFGGIDFRQVNNQNSTVAELKSHFNSSMSNSFLLGYSNIHDYRRPSSDPAFPQIEISSGGGTIFLGTDREASIFDLRQRTFELTNNFTWVKDNHQFTFGTHNEFYNINYGFVNAWNGRVNYGSVDAFLNNQPSRVRTNFNYDDNSRESLVDNPPANFNVNLYSLYAQDDIQIGQNLRLSPGIRFDMAQMPSKPILSEKTTDSPIDPQYGTTFTYTQPSAIRNDFLGQIQVSPRLGFNYDVFGTNQLIMRGGSGIFTGRIPFAWLGYAYYNNGDSFGAFDRRYTYTGDNPSMPAPGSDPISDSMTGEGAAGFVRKQGVDPNNALSATQVDLIDNNFKMPQAWRSHLAFDYLTEDRWKFTLEGIYTKVISDLKFQFINLKDNPIYMPYDTDRQQPIYRALDGSQAINPAYTSAYLLSNTNKGYRYSITGQVAKSFPMGFDLMAAYTYGQSKDITNGIRNSMESNWQMNQALNPNDPQLAYSNFDIRHRIVNTMNYRTEWMSSGKWISNFSLFFNAQSGLPYTLGFVNRTTNGTGQNVGLAYIPLLEETAMFFAATDAGRAQAAAFDAYIDSDSYLRGRRGKFTERNGARTPWNYQADFRFSQDYHIIREGKRTQTITFTYDIINLTNLLSKNWGIQYFAPNTFNSTSSIGLTPVEGQAGSATAYPQYTFSEGNVTNYSRDFFASRWQMQFGLRYSF
ncbi:TonB-dependent receptor [Sphingobacterium corticibacter]|uniref:TonB-dependent receptor n=1 Tax=Sphingobacterium corticibacter TaxID=2171749 RepID=A0A2T8HGN8_9SPHI|nr:carboxypeptidase regulatory-like domain-containing protein [Sphingobacterium corticibacter]PVH24608.1 TonB-dependent receptor [Sphingobacterium corticibacter]